MSAVSAMHLWWRHFGRKGFPLRWKNWWLKSPDCVITRANIARFLYEHGQIKSVREAFDRYIGDHCKCYVGRLKVASTDAVRLIKEARGTAILAHPLLYGLSNTNLQKMIDELKPAGLDGLEAIYSTYTTGEETADENVLQGKNRTAYQWRL